MKPNPGKHRLLLPTPVDREFFLDIVQLVETQKLHELKIQAQIDQLSATCYYVSCDIDAYNIRKGILALERETYKLHSRLHYGKHSLLRDNSIYLIRLSSL